jgi:YVTN family beta-propeller protein
VDRARSTRIPRSSSLLASRAAALAVGLALVGAAFPADAGRNRGGASHEPAGHLTWESPQSNPIALSPDGSRLFVAATTSDQVDVIDTATNTRVAQIPVGIEPVAIAVKPGGSQVWVSNHVSDSVSVIDTATLQVIETVQDIDSNGVTQFDEPVGIAFKEDGSRAYVALSSRNDIADVDTTTYSVLGRVHVRAQDPRAIAVRNGRLYVAPFESGNQSELSLCASLSDDTRPNQCTMDASDFGAFATNPNLPTEVKNIVVDDDLPDRDVFVYDVSTDPPTEIETVSGVGTLLYGLAVSAAGEVFVAQTDARNAVNGLQDKNSVSDVNNDHVVNLADLQNRMFLNQIGHVSCGGSCGTPGVFELEPLPPSNPAPGDQLATPYGIALTADDSLLVITAAAASRVASVNASTGAVLDRLDVGAIPRAVVLRSNGDGTHTGWVLNSLDDTVTRILVDNATGALSQVAVVDVGNDPTPLGVRLGRIAFHNANASTTGTFACASCHPDGNTDQILWRIGGECFLNGCIQDGAEPRTTMPVRGLRDTVPLHWDGTLGDPFGGPNGATGIPGDGGTDCVRGDADGDHDCFADLIQATLAGAMCDQDSCSPTLTTQEIDDMATFLERISYPPARSRRMDDALSAAAQEGFRQFFFNVGGIVGQPDTCADSDAGCHELPLGPSTTAETLEGFDAPTMRGLTDRFVQFSLGPTSTQEILDASNIGITATIQGFQITGPPNDFPYDYNQGLQETSTFGAAFVVFNFVYGSNAIDIFPMFEEASTGFSGALGRQVTLNMRTTTGGLQADTETLLDALEDADLRGVVNLRGEGWRGGAVTISYLGGQGVYQVGNAQLSHADVISEAQGGTLTATLTAELRRNVSVGNPQPLVSVPNGNCGTGTGPTGDPALPQLTGANTTMQLETAHVAVGDVVFVDGVPLSGATISLTGTSSCAESVTPNLTTVTLNTAVGVGAHVLQIQKPGGLLSNELLFRRAF